MEIAQTFSLKSFFTLAYFYCKLFHCFSLQQFHVQPSLLLDYALGQKKNKVRKQHFLHFTPFQFNSVIDERERIFVVCFCISAIKNDHKKCWSGLPHLEDKLSSFSQMESKSRQEKTCLMKILPFVKVDPSFAKWSIRLKISFWLKMKYLNSNYEYFVIHNSVVYLFSIFAFLLLT